MHDSIVQEQRRSVANLKFAGEHASKDAVVAAASSTGYDSSRRRSLSTGSDSQTKLPTYSALKFKIKIQGGRTN